VANLFGQNARCCTRLRIVRNGWLTYLLAVVLVLYFIFVRSRMG
jgi:hypothetical protein